MELNLNADIEKIKFQYDNLGWAKVESVLTDNQVDLVLQNISGFVEANRSLFLEREINYVDGLVNSIHCLHKYENAFLKSIQENPKIKDLVGQLMNTEAECQASEAFLKPAQKGLPSPWHQDNYYWCIKDNVALTCWIALDDVDESNGGVTYYDGSHKGGIYPHEASFMPGSSQKISAAALKLLTSPSCPKLKKGDMLIHHSLTVHGSSANTSGKSRRAMTIQYKAKNAVYDLERKKQYEQSLQEQIKLRQR